MKELRTAALEYFYQQFERTAGFDELSVKTLNFFSILNLNLLYKYIRSTFQELLKLTIIMPLFKLFSKNVCLYGNKIGIYSYRPISMISNFFSNI